MAGYTSRFFLSLTIPSVFGFLSVLWFLKRKTPSKSISRAIQVEESEDFEKQFVTLDPMKLKNKEDNSEESVSSEMQLKETQTSPQPPNANGVQLNGTAKGKKKSKSKIREKNCTFQKDYILNDNDRHSSLEDNGIELTNGIEAIDLNSTNVSAKDELLLNAINKIHIDMEITNGTDPSQTCVHTNGDSRSSDPENHTDVKTDSLSIQQNGASAKEQCDTDIQVSTEDRNSPLDHKSETDIPPTLQIDSHEPLTLPVDYTEATGEMLESPGATYCDSVGSNDSGKGPSEIQYDADQMRQMRVTYEFEIFQEYVGLLIGRNGRHVHFIKEETNTDIIIKNHICHDKKKICCLTGTDDEIHAALKLIRKRFPIETYPTVTLSQLCFPYDMQQPDLLKLSLPEGVTFDVMLSATVNAGHFFLQQPTHPTFHSLPPLSEMMSNLYNNDINAPLLHMVQRGNICAASIGTSWYRAEVDEVFDDTDECRVKFLDYGGYTVVPRLSLRQIRRDFMCVPFQATECYLGAVTYPDGSTDWSREATAAFQELALGQFLQGVIIGYAENRIPYVRLYKVTGVNAIDINEELVRQGFAKSLLPTQQ